MKVSSLPIRTVVLSCACCLCLPFFGMASSLPAPVEPAVETLNTTADTACPSTTTAEGTYGTVMTLCPQRTRQRSVRQQPVKQQPVKGQLFLRRKPRRLLLPVRPIAKRLLPLHRRPGSEIVWAPFDWPMKPVPSPYDKLNSDEDSRYSHILSEIRLPNKIWIHGIKHNDECYIIPEELPVLAEIYGGGLQYDFSDLQVMEQFLNSGDDVPSVLQGIALTVSSEEGGTVTTKTVLWYDESTVNQPAYDSNLMYWTYNDRVLISNHDSVSPLHLYVWHWFGSGQTDSFICAMRMLSPFLSKSKLFSRGRISKM